jgi:hypothetical protein
LLEALERNGDGHLWSIDLPPLLQRDLAEETGAAVPARLHERWTLLRGSSRKLLPDLLADLGQIDLFAHDSMHTTRNLRFELKQVWPALTPGGAMLIDDVEENPVTGQFLQTHPQTPAVIAPSDDGQVLIAWLLKPSRQETARRVAPRASRLPGSAGQSTRGIGVSRLSTDLPALVRKAWRNVQDQY